MIAGDASVPENRVPDSEAAENELGARRFTVTPLIELAVLAASVTIAVVSYFILARGSRDHLLPTAMIAALLVSNLIPGVALLMLLGRRIARQRAARSPIGGEGRLHVRLVALFSIMATVPMLLVALAASLLFQYGVQLSSSERARGMLVNATTLVRENYQREVNSVASQTATMSSDLLKFYLPMGIETRRFSEGLLYQTYKRELSEAMIVRRNDKDPLAVLNPYGRPLENIVTPAMTAKLDAGAPAIILRSRDRIGALVPLDRAQGTYLYASRIFDEQLASQLRRGGAILADYRALQARSRVLQFRFNAALLLVSLLVVGAAVWIALQLADRMVQPVNELVGAARRVAEGDLGAQVAAPRTRDEVGVLARAFNRMTERLQQQTTALENRRALIEAVMSGVSAGVISIDRSRVVQIINRSALALLGIGDNPVGRPLVTISAELDELVRSGARESILQLGGGVDSATGEGRTLAVRIEHADFGPILTFDDITLQLQDQRRAAWADVARRVAHEIKNPLTPIQLAAERLQRRYGKTVPADDTTFARLTETIVRQVSDLRRMVDEFSSFARMPKPEFRPEALADIARQSLFLHEVAHPAIRYVLDGGEPGPTLVCDRRQIGQALTNIVKNATEAIEAKGGEGGEVVMQLVEDGTRVTITCADNGVGLPADRERIVEPYVTTRARGTGLGLAIVKKIAEEHAGTIAFDDRAGGGTVVTMTFDAATLAARHDGADAGDANSVIREPVLLSSRS